MSKLVCAWRRRSRERFGLGSSQGVSPMPRTASHVKGSSKPTSLPVAAMLLHHPIVSQTRCWLLCAWLRKSSKLSGEGNLNQAEWVLKRALEKSTLVLASCHAALFPTSWWYHLVYERTRAQVRLAEVLPVADPDLLVSRLNLGATSC